MDEWVHVWMYGCMDVCIDVGVWMYDCMDVCMDVCMDGCTY